MSNNLNTFSQNDYIAFDAMSLRQLIINRLNEQGVFTDQNYIGSNLASIIDIVAYAYNTLIYYLNKTSTESMFTEAQLYENINRIVKMLDYKPIGNQTSTLIVNCSAGQLFPNLYTIPRYSFIIKNNIAFSFNEDITFAKTEPFGSLQNISEVSQQKSLYQGRFREYPLYTAIGQDNEVVLLDTANSLVDHFNIDVYVKSIQTNTWKQYSKTPSLYLEDGVSEKYEIRLNSNKRYEIKFGNDINGKKLSSGDQIAIYYLTSDGLGGEVGPNTFNTYSGLISLKTPQFLSILADLNKNDTLYLSDDQCNRLIFNNITSSTSYQEGESANEIRTNAPNTYKQQYRLVTTQDYETFTKTNFGNFLTDVKAFNNWNYVTEYLKYFYDIGITNTSLTDRALFNQIQYSDSCNFNNVYLIVVPKTNNSLSYLLPAQKQLIESTIQPVKMLTTEISFIDPVYKAVSLGVNSQNSFETTDFLGFFDASLIVYKDSQLSDETIKNSIVNIFSAYFSNTQMKLGQTLNMQYLTQEILSIPGIQSLQTAQYDTDTGNLLNSVDGLSFQVWNPLYPDNDRVFTQKNITSRFFEYFYFFDIENLYNKITVQTLKTPYQGTGY
jgi:hypothetical protein